ncbi:MAG TPA: HAMP domain-containing sensor histidine kinase [Labilithrix sp.]|nr:HAMP domain-containing sensor histidine kinase [Labilithrix sp.]
MPTAHADSKPTRVGPGLRVQILLALGGVILVAYVPLFFAIAQVTRANALAYREESARALGRAVAAHVGDLATSDPQAIASRLDSHVGEGGALAIAVYGSGGTVEASAGPAAEVAALHAPAKPYGEAATRIATRAGTRGLDVVLPAGERAVLVRVRTDEDATRSADVVRGIALYMGVFALALLVFAYSLLTRGIVKPIELLARAADRVASGARSLELPSTGAREIADLGASVRSMAARLIADEKKLRAKVDELTTTTQRLGETREQLAGSERMASVGRLAAGVAHEIGNPIAAIMGMHDLIEDAETPEETRADFLKRMRKETERINVVVRDLLDYARPESGPPSGRLAAANVAEVAADALALVRPQKEWKGIDVRVDIPADVEVMLSPQRLTQVLLNLLLNAAAALADQPSDATRTLTVRAQRSGEAMVRIEVEDDGPGVPEALRDRIFDPFVTTKDVGSGTGLGLAVCRGIIEGAGGRISVDATYTQGARFVITLPAGTFPAD